MFRRLSGAARRLVLLALVVRLLVWWWVVANGVPAVYDEAVYLDHASGWANFFRGGGSEAIEDALGEGRWPPLHAISLGLVLAAGGGIASARLLGVVIGALSTGLLFAFSRRLVSRRAAAVAALVYALAPTFVFYSHSLWSENLALLLGLAGLIAAIDCRRLLLCRRPGALGTLGAAALAGVLLGAVALCRVALLPWSVAIPLWLLAIKGVPIRRRFGAAALCLGATLLSLAPWLFIQSSRFGHFGMSTLSGYNFALGNNAQVPAGYGSSWGHQESTTWLQAELRQRAGEDWKRAGAALAFEEIQARPWPALIRVPIRLWLLGAPDVLPMRHLLHADYPPLAPAFTIMLMVWIMLAHVLPAALGVAGLVVARCRQGPIFLPLLFGATLLPPALSVSATRFHLPLEILLLPFLGAFLTRQQRPGWGRHSVLLAVLVAAISLATLPRVAELYWRPSAHVASWLGPMMRPLGVELLYSDRYRIERGDRNDGEVEIVVRGDGIRLAPRLWLGRQEDSRRRLWPAPVPLASTDVASDRLDFDVFSTGQQAAVIELIGVEGMVLARWDLRTAKDRPWRRPRAHGAYALSWLGGGRSPR